MIETYPPRGQISHEERNVYNTKQLCEGIPMIYHMTCPKKLKSVVLHINPLSVEILKLLKHVFNCSFNRFIFCNFTLLLKMAVEMYQIIIHFWPPFTAQRGQFLKSLIFMFNYLFSGFIFCHSMLFPKVVAETSQIFENFRVLF